MDSVAQYVMSEVFAAINHRLSEEYIKIELPTPDAKERLLADAHYLHEKFSVLKAPGAPTAVLETLVADKRVANAPASSQPATPTPVPSSPVPLPPGDIPLGSPRPPVPPPTKRASLFSNERLKGILSRGGTQSPPSAPAPAPVQVPAQEKQGGYKQIAVLLSPAPLPVEKHHELPTTPISVPIHATPSPTPIQLQLEEQHEPATEPPNGDASVAVPDGQADAGTDRVPQGHGEDHAPPTPAKDDSTRNGRMASPEPASEGTRVVAA